MAIRVFVIVIVAVAFFSSSRAEANCQNLDFGSCTNPSISFGYNFSGSGVWGYETNNEADFPHSWTSDVATLESFICSRLQSPCNAPTDTLYSCRGALNELRSLTGQSAADSWNNALGLSSDDGSSDCDGTTVYAQGYATTITITDYASETAGLAFSTLTVTALSGSTSTYTNAHTSPSSSNTISSRATLTVTVTLQSSATSGSTKSQEESSVHTVTVTEISTPSTTSATASATSTTSQSSSKSSSSSTTTSTGKGSNIGDDSPFESGTPAPICANVIWPLVATILTLFHGVMIYL